MTIFTVLKFPTAGGAARMQRTLQKLQEQRQIHIEDGAIVTWPLGARHPRIKQLSDLAGIGAVGGGFGGLLCGLLFSVPFSGVTTGTVIGALASPPEKGNRERQAEEHPPEPTTQSADPGQIAELFDPGVPG